MPMGKYPDFASCIRDQMKKGYSKEQAGGVCGLIEKRHKAKHDLATRKGYQNKDECIADMITRGHTQDDANQMCRHVRDSDELTELKNYS